MKLLCLLGLLLMPCLSNAEQKIASNSHGILKMVYSDCRNNFDVMTCVDKLTIFGKQVGLNGSNGDLELSIFLLVQDDLSKPEK